MLGNLTVMDNHQRAVEPTAFLYLADGRVFVSHNNGVITEATKAHLWDAEFLLVFDAPCTLDPIRGLEVSPPGDS